ncbi:hypothetical protein BC830DRAFT_1139525 [Chytriomyces sp. MP71]|nr:hypothetical protein BC830DRAFT_1139525 [Chytriomyces sp. MP71]
MRTSLLLASAFAMAVQASFWEMVPGAKHAHSAHQSDPLVVVAEEAIVDRALIAEANAFDAPIGGGRRLIVCVDGTWNSPGSLADAHSMGGLKETAVLTPSNIVKLAYLLNPSDKHQFDPTNTDERVQFQKVYYHSGVATEQKDTKQAQLEGNFGNIHEHLLDAYAWLAREYQPGDEISAFGFSRGSTIVRSLFSFIRFAGLVDPSTFPDHSTIRTSVLEAFNLYRTRQEHETGHAARILAWKEAHCHPHVDLKLIAVMDTVEALDVPEGYSSILPSKYLTDIEESLGAIEPNNYHDLDIGLEVEHAYHAIAIDESREFFPPTLFEHVDPAHLKPNLVREQRWFRGSHADIGGGWYETGLSNIVLDWMISNARAAGLYVKPIEAFEAVYTPMLLGISKEDYLARSAVVKHDYFEWIGSKDGSSPMGKSIPRDLKGRYMAEGKFGASALHESVFEVLREEPVPVNLKPFFS